MTDHRQEEGKPTARKARFAAVTSASVEDIAVEVCFLEKLRVDKTCWVLLMQGDIHLLNDCHVHQRDRNLQITKFCNSQVGLQQNQPLYDQGLNGYNTSSDGDSCRIQVTIYSSNPTC